MKARAVLIVALAALAGAAAGFAAGVTVEKKTVGMRLVKATFAPSTVTASNIVLSLVNGDQTDGAVVELYNSGGQDKQVLVIASFLDQSGDELGWAVDGPITVPAGGYEYAALQLNSTIPLSSLYEISIEISEVTAGSSSGGAGLAHAVQSIYGGGS